MKNWCLKVFLLRVFGLRQCPGRPGRRTPKMNSLKLKLVFWFGGLVSSSGSARGGPGGERPQNE